MTICVWIKIGREEGEKNEKRRGKKRRAVTRRESRRGERDRDILVGCEALLVDKRYRLKQGWSI